MRPDELEQRRVDRGPDRAGGRLVARVHLDAVLHDRLRQRLRRGSELAHVLDGDDDLQVELLALPGVDERDLAVGPGHPAADLGERALRRRQADPLERLRGDALEPLEREGEMGAALRAGDGVDLVEDHRLDRLQQVAAARREQEVERLGRRDQDVGRRPQHPLAVALRRVARPHAHRERRADPRERPAEVPLDVVVERLERRDVEEPHPLAGRVVEPVEAEEERGERLARAGRRLDEDVPPARDRGPGELLRGRRRRRTRARTTPSCAARARRAHPPAERSPRGPPRVYGLPYAPGARSLALDLVPYAPLVAYDVAVVGGGTAGCVLAARLSEDPDRRVCLIEAGPDYGARGSGAWPDDLLDPRTFCFTHDWGTGGEDDRSLGARVIGGCSTHNACMAVVGTPADYDEWGHAWRYEAFAPYLARARDMLRVVSANTAEPAPLHIAFLEAAGDAGLHVLDNPDDPAQPVGRATLPANVVEGTRWNAAFAYLDPARSRPNLSVLAEAAVDRLILDGERAVGVLTAAGERIDAGVVVLAAGAYFTPAILLRSGVGPEDELARHSIPVVLALPVGEALLDHHGTGIGWERTPVLDRETADHVARTGPVFRPHSFVKAASTSCAPGSWDVHLLSWVSPSDDGSGYEAGMSVFHMKPGSAGCVRLRSGDPSAAADGRARVPPRPGRPRRRRRGDRAGAGAGRTTAARTAPRSGGRVRGRSSFQRMPGGRCATTSTPRGRAGSAAWSTSEGASSGSTGSSSRTPR